jgi:hypothetical protein
LGKQVAPISVFQTTVLPEADLCPLPGMGVGGRLNVEHQGRMRPWVQGFDYFTEHCFAPSLAFSFAAFASLLGWVLNRLNKASAQLGLGTHVILR